MTTTRRDFERFTYTVVGLLALTAAGTLGAAQIKDLRMWAGPNSTRIVFDVTSPVEHKVFVLESPYRVVIDIKNTTLKAALPKLNYAKSLLKRVRHAKRNKRDLRVVLDVKTRVKPKSFVLKPTGKYGHRLVIDLEDLSARARHKTAKTPEIAIDKKRLVVIAIDAGHGGEDPGAVGNKGTKEKDVVYAIARRMEALLKKQEGMKPVMIRRGDYYVSLRERMQKARVAKADLFISIHADAVENGLARGASVFVLSQKGASSEAARWLAVSQNNSDLIGGVSLDDKDDLLALVLLDLAQNATIAASTEAGVEILKQLEGIGSVHKQSIEQAGFVVLKSPDIPSILVETGFISNTKEELKLRDHRFQAKLALALVKGIKKYILKNPPPGSIWAQKEQHHLVIPIAGRFP